MSVCIQTGEQETISPAEGPARSSSPSSSSSFDSCSDLLGSLEHAEESLDDSLKGLPAPYQENESQCGVEDGAAGDQAVQPEDMPAHGELKKEQQGSSTMPAELDDVVKQEGPSIKDQVYGLSNAISFTKMRSLAENTVGRISQLQTTFRLPTSYIFPSRNAVPPPLPDGDPDESRETPDPGLEQPVDGKDGVLDRNSNVEGSASADASYLLQKEGESVAQMPFGDSYPSMESDDLDMDTCSSQDKVGLMSQKSTMEEKGEHFATDSLPVAGSSSDVGTAGTIVNDRMRNSDPIPLGGSNDESDVDAFRNSDATPSDPLGAVCVLQKDALSKLTDDSVPTTGAIDATKAVDEKRLTGKVDVTASSNDTCSTSADSAEVSTEMLSHLDGKVLADMVLQNAACPQDHAKQMSGEESDVLPLENSTMASDLRKKKPVICHPLLRLSSGSGRPDLEEVEDEQGVAARNKTHSVWNSGSTNVGMLANGYPFELWDDAHKYGAPLSSAELHNLVDDREGNEWSSLADDKPHTSSSLGEQQLEALNPSVSNIAKGGKNVLWIDRPMVDEALEQLQSGFRQNHYTELESYGGISHEDRWKDLTVQLKRNSNEGEEKEDLGPDELFRYLESLELNESYADTVLDMEDVLLDNDENGSRERFLLASSNSVIGTPRSSRDGSLSSSTSGLQLLTSGDSTPFTVDWVEVVGAKQRKGGSSFGERIVGVKDHTVYCIKVSSGSQQWELLRRYRDFVDLYHQLRRKFNARTGRPLPSPWKDIDRDSRKVFGSTHPNVIEIRSTRIEKCLQSLLQAGPPMSTSSPLYWFLSPQGTSKPLSGGEVKHTVIFPSSQKGLDVQLGTMEPPSLQSPRWEVGSFKSEPDNDKSSLALGKTVKLNLKIHPNKNLKQLLSAQHNSCAGCYKHLDLERGLVQGFVQTLGWGKPRFCEYSGQLYCTACHLNEIAVLPAQVLWHWDFTPRRVSQLAKAYLDSIYDQPMLCVSAVNPHLYSRVPILSHVKETRKKLSRMLSCMLCPSRTRICQNMASRRYLLENNDFFALRDLEDLSKGAFAVLPGILTAVMDSLRLHITKQCSVCSETGDWCGAGILCEEPFSPIFPFEEENVATCKVCHTVFHKACFSRFNPCPACAKDQSNLSELAGGAAQAHHREEELSEEHAEEPGAQNAAAAEAAPPSTGESEVQTTPFVSDKQSQSPRRNWPSLYGILPKKRLW